MLKQADLQAAYEYGVKQAYYDLQKHAGHELDAQRAEQGMPSQFAGSPGAEAGVGSTAEVMAEHPKMRGPGTLTEAELLELLQGKLQGRAQGVVGQAGGLLDKAKGVGGQVLDEVTHLPNGRQIMAGADNVANRFLGHMGRHPAAYGLGAAGIGAAGLTGLGLGIGNAVHNSND